ncbi:MAG: hypothetical protein WD794_16665 [Mycobacteriales bacterium]
MTVTQERPVDERPMIGCPARRHTRTIPPSCPGAEAGPPRLADGVQLLGEYAGTGYRTPQYLARRPGGQLVQLSMLLHQIAEQCDGTRTPQQIASEVSATYGKTVSADNVQALVDKLRPLGILAAADGSDPEVQESDPLLGLRLRARLLTPKVVQRLAGVVRPVFWPPLVLAVVAGLLAVDVWLFFLHGVGAGLRSTVEQPFVFLLVAAVLVVSAALHEFGHAAACAYGGARPGGMGAGIYVVWPAFYTDVTDAYRLDRRGRLRTDLGGVYVNAMIVVLVALTYAATRYEPLVLICFLLQLQVLQQMLPFLRLDGYYVVSDLVGVPDLFRRIGPVLRSAIPFRATEPEVAELKPWVRRVVAGWVFVLVPVLVLNLGYFLLAAPRIAATSWDSGARFAGQLMSSGGTVAVVAAAQLILLLLPIVGISYTLSRVARRGAAGAWRWSEGSPGRRLGVITGGAALLVSLAVAWFPDGRLTPYRDGERGTVQQHVGELSTLGRGAPLLRSPGDAQEPLPAVPEGSSSVLGTGDAADAGTDGSSPDGAGDGATTDGGQLPAPAVSPTTGSSSGTASSSPSDSTPSSAPDSSGATTGGATTPASEPQTVDAAPSPEPTSGTTSSATTAEPSPAG